MTSTIFLLTFLASVLSTTLACDMTPVSGFGSPAEAWSVGDIVTNTKICQSMGEGYYTFAMVNTMTGQLPGSDSPDEGPEASSMNAVGIMDNGCHLLAAYSIEETQGEYGIPWVIQGDFLQYVLTIQKIDYELGEGYFDFSYANGKYTIGNNGCICQNLDGSGLSTSQTCGCSFPVAGEPTKIKGRQVYAAKDFKDSGRKIEGFERKVEGLKGKFEGSGRNLNGSCVGIDGECIED
ncbi:MAG: hypothetical protein M1820_008742 [Bogoriella megaspora]|nr:MAG: hypothetical protein M1820_008742 [Bogoriella megaspora]